MKFFAGKISFAVSVCALLLTSCFKDEDPNPECDILSASVSVADPSALFFNLSDTMVSVISTDSDVVFSVRRGADLTALAPHFRLTPGATISPANGSVHDFSAGAVDYVVTSEDKKWHRRYSVSFRTVTHTVGDTLRLDFEHFALESSEGKYYVWQRLADDGTLSPDWASGNGGFRLSMGTAKPDEYPTTPYADGYDGYAAKLTTRSTGAFGAMANKRLAAGNLFLGQFVVETALLTPLKATRFGIPYDSQPVTFTGYYRYAPGPSYQDRAGKIIPGKTDSAAVYAVFYRNHDAQGNAAVLYGDDVKTSPLIVAIADAKYLAPTDEWTPFTIDFDYRGAVDSDLLEGRGYSLAVVFSSSSGGDDFCGAIGSTLLVDKVRIISKKEE